jgi:hypothetical protein
LAEAPPEGIACQVTFTVGAIAAGALRKTSTPGVYQMLVQAQDKQGRVQPMKRYLPAEAIYMIDEPMELPSIQPAGGRIILPQG